MGRVFFKFIAGLLLAAAVPAEAGGKLSLKDCAHLFRSLHVNGVLFKDLLQDQANEATVTFGKELEGRHGGKRHVVRKLDGKPWGSEYQEAVNAPQGDPRSYIELLGVEGAKFFGFEMLSETEMTVPDAAEFNGAIEKINVKLVAQGLAPIPIRLYEQHGSAVVDYVDHWGNGLAPLNAKLNTHRVHDLSVHSGVVFLPPEVAEHSQFVTKELIRFADAAQAEVLDIASRTEGLDEADRELLKWYKSYLLLAPTKYIDLGTAYLMAGYLTAGKRDKFSPTGSDGFKTAVGVLSYSFQEGDPTSGSAHNAVLLSFMATIEHGEALKVASPNKVTRLQAVLQKVFEAPARQTEMETFIEGYVAERAAESPRFSQGAPLSEEAGCALAIGRLQAIRKAAQLLGQESPK